MIEIITHCFGRDYAALLTYHLSSIVIRESDLITMTVVYISDDDYVTNVLEYFSKIDRPWIKWNFIPMAAQLVYQRPIGRNITAKLSKADIVWYADCDYIFGDDCMDTLQLCKISNNTVYWPGIVHLTDRKTKTQMINTAIYNEHMALDILDADTACFRSEPMRKAVGGAQIVSGETAREKGYLPDSQEWQRPFKKYQRDDGSAFWREQFKMFEKLELPNVYRI